MAAFTLSSSITATSTYSIAVTASGGQYVLSGRDKNGSVSGNNVTVIVNVGDTLNFVVNASGHPFFIKTSATTGTGNQVSTPAATNNGTQSGTVSWTPNTAGTYYYICQYHGSMVGTINVSAATASIVHQNAAIEFKQSTATAFVTPTFQSVTKAITGGTPVNYNLTTEDPITPSVRGWLFGRRPASGMLYPRGIYNK